MFWKFVVIHSAPVMLASASMPMATWRSSTYRETSSGTALGRASRRISRGTYVGVDVILPDADAHDDGSGRIRLRETRRRIHAVRPFAPALKVTSVNGLPDWGPWMVVGTNRSAKTWAPGSHGLSTVGALVMRSRSPSWKGLR